MFRATSADLISIFQIAMMPHLALAHCQVPRGIYDDAARIARMNEDATTIEKAMVQMQEPAGKADAQSANQLTRWIMTKEEQAANTITTVAEYPLTRKVKQGSDPASKKQLRAAPDAMGGHDDLEHGR